MGVITQIQGGKKPAVHTEVIMSSQNWVVPNGVSSVFVRIFGAGGCGGGLNYAGGGGGGNMNTGVFNVNAGQVIPVTIAPPPLYGGGGASSFGNYITATGGQAGYSYNGAGGGSGGGGFGDTNRYETSTEVFLGCPGGDGYYGGGGGSATNWSGDLYNICGRSINNFYAGKRNDVCHMGGNGGLYGGGGGSAYYLYWYNNSFDQNAYNLSYAQFFNNTFFTSAENGNARFSGKLRFLGGQGGEYGGDAGQNGTNTIGKGLEIEGPGLAGTTLTTSTYPYINAHLNGAKGDTKPQSAGGGGYGGCGGHSGKYESVTKSWTNASYHSAQAMVALSGGGGGGYGSNGGNGANGSRAGGGGGGGYGGDGGDASGYQGGGGGGYFAKGGTGGQDLNTGVGPAAGGGGLQGRGNNSMGSSRRPMGGSGICVIQYKKI